MTNYVADYRRLDDNASADETQAEQYRRRADENRWEQCRIAYEATTEGGYSHHKFADAVGKGKTTISRQVAIWQRWGDPRSGPRPTYGQAIDDHHGSTIAERGAQMVRGRIRNLPPEDKLDLVREFVDDPDVGDQVVEIVEDEGIQRRASRAAAYPPERDPDEAAERVRRNFGRAVGHDTDQATDYLRGAANDLAHAGIAKENYGIDYPADEAEALEKVERWLAIYRGQATLTDDDRGWAESIGVQL